MKIPRRMGKRALASFDDAAVLVALTVAGLLDVGNGQPAV